MGHRRHWKQRWDPNASFVFTRRMKLGLDTKNPWVYPGDDVPTGDVRLGRGRLRKWWDAGIIAIKGWTPGSQALAPAIDAAKGPAPVPEPVEPVTVEVTTPGPGPEVELTADGVEVSMPDGSLAAVDTMEEAIAFIQTGELPEPKPDTEVVVEAIGGGWFNVTVPGESEPRKVQGQTAVDELLAELGGSE